MTMKVKDFSVSFYVVALLKCLYGNNNKATIMHCIANVTCYETGKIAAEEEVAVVEVIAL